MVGVKIDIPAAQRSWIPRAQTDTRRRPEGHLRLVVMTLRRAAQKRLQSARRRGYLGLTGRHKTPG